MSAVILPPLSDDTRLTVVIPARNEETTLPLALAALDRQVGFDGSPLSSEVFDVVVLANGCNDGSASVGRTRSAARRTPRVIVIEANFPAAVAHIGTVRRTLMDAAAHRFLRAGKRRGIIASTDADSEVDRYWIAATIEEMKHVDAVTGRIQLAPPELARLDRATRLLYLRDQIHRRLVAELDAIIDPVDHDPLPRHGQHFGASFAVAAEVYIRAGGVPPRPKHEDIAFYEALERIDARVRHSMRVRVATSARIVARAQGGFATFLGELETHGSLTVEAPALTLVRLETRAMLRRLWRNGGLVGDPHTVCAVYGCSRDEWKMLFNQSEPFGANLSRIEAFAARRWCKFAPVAIEDALPAIRHLRARATVAAKHWPSEQSERV